MKLYQKSIATPVIVVFALLFSFCAFAVSIVGFDNFEQVQEYRDNFVDVPPTEWYYDNVAASYEYSLLLGRSSNSFAPKEDVTLAETLTVSSRIYSIYFSGEQLYFDAPGEAWYSNYVTFAKDVGILTADYPDYDAPATRAQFAAILAASVDPAEFAENEINWIDDGAIPGVSMEAEYAEAVYMLYRARILTGSDEYGAFNPDDSITRAEAAAIITRIVDPDLRKSLDLYGEY